MFEKLNDRYTRIFERPAPKIYCDKAVIEASSPPGFYDGYFIVKNTGGGNLEGDIFAQSSFISFSTQVIEGNDLIIEFEIDLNHMQPGDFFLSQIVITTTGGQLVIPVKIAIKTYGIVCGRFEIHSLQDFCGCVRAIPDEAAELFVTDEFEQWLVKSKCSHMEFYRRIAKGNVGFKEMDSFLTVAGFKKKAVLLVPSKSITVPVNFDDNEIKQTIPLACNTWGHFEYTVSAENNSEWLKLSKEKITNADFEKENFTYRFSVDAAKMPETRCFDTIVFKNGTERLTVDITAQRPKLFRVKLSRFSYGNEDSGYLIVENHTGRNAMLEVSSTEDFVRFKSEKYFVEENTEVPFEIKVNSFLNLGFGKKPVNIAEISCKTVIDGKMYKENLTVKAGSLLG